MLGSYANRQGGRAADVTPAMQSVTDPTCKDRHGTLGSELGPRGPSVPLFEGHSAPFGATPDVTQFTNRA